MRELSDYLPSLSVSAAVAVVVLTIATATDLRSQKIYNVLTYPAILLGLSLAGLVSLGLTTSGIRLTESLLGVVACGGVMLIPYSHSGGGAGDVKLAMAIGSLVGFDSTIQAFCIGYIVAALFLVVRFIILRGVGGLRHFHDGFASFWEAVGAPSSRVGRPIALSGFFACGMAANLLNWSLW